MKNAAGLSAAYMRPALGLAQTAPTPRRFHPHPGTWRTFEVTTCVDIHQADGATRVWRPMPSVDADWQRSMDSRCASNGATRMRLETPQWIKNTTDPVVAPVNRALFGGCAGHWLAWNMAHGVALPGAQGPKPGFLMYPACETADERLDAYSPDAFEYQITARELKV